ncbi:MAG: ABC transporter substrate-binding protein [Alphaproteobacteria bacterium]|nr:MAG: ABC transporter substrate-binding protein [Alphaproteobacteria bacterium]
MIRHAFIALFALGLGAPVSAAEITLQETPSLAERVAAGELPPVAERVPQEPLVVDLALKGREFGRPGGTLRMFITKPRDIRYMVVYGYARLVGYDHDYKLKPDILRAVDQEEGRIFTFHLRKGHRWSDGHPFTTEDFRYWWEDVANNKMLSPGGVPELMLVDGKPPQVTVIDETTIRYAWDRPNPRFLHALAAARPPFIYRPAHWMKQFHADYRPKAELDALVAENGMRNWAQLHNARDNMYKFDVVGLPTLQPWYPTTGKNAQGYDLVRNPFYHRIDARGVQLPYIDRVELTIAAGGLIPQKIGLGEADLQVRSLTFTDAPVLKQGERQGNYTTYLWSNGAASEIALYPNQNYEDPAFRALFRDARFRRALSVAISRKTINKTLFFGLAKESNMAPLKGSPFYDPKLSAAWAQYDPDLANRLLDELGLTARDGDGTRLLPDGRRLEIVVETAGERQEESDALELVAEMWAEVGVRLIFRPLDRDILRNKAYSGQSMMPVWYGWNNGLPTPDAPPSDLAPVDQTNFSWPKWGQYTQTKGQAGEPPQTPEAKRLLELFRAWEMATSDEGRAAAWREMLKIHADQIFAIGLVNAAPQPLIASNRLRNVPKTGIYAWEPGAHLGIHRIDEFWFAE